jgi:hypothetical protein
MSCQTLGILCVRKGGEWPKNFYETSIDVVRKYYSDQPSEGKKEIQKGNFESPCEEKKQDDSQADTFGGSEEQTNIIQDEKRITKDELQPVECFVQLE